MGIRACSLIMGKGGGYKTGGGASEVLPLQKGGVTKSFEVVLTGSLKF